jgi:hypothetical protein
MLDLQATHSRRDLFSDHQRVLPPARPDDPAGARLRVMTGILW